MKRNPTTTLLVSTYNRPDALDACLTSAERLNKLPDEIVIADDGSGPSTEEVVRRHQSQSPVKILHVRHEDRGFRLAAIRNKAIAASSGEYIIQIDGDEILHPDFISDHLRYSRKGSFAKGCRVMTGKRLAQLICADPRAEVGRLSWKRDGIEKDRLKGIRCRPAAWWFANFFKRRDYYALGGNMGFWREDLIAVNGYDERFEGWGREDDDIAHRLGRLGLTKRDLRFTAVCFHLWHPENSRGRIAANDEFFKEQDRLGITRCADGLDKYL